MDSLSHILKSFYSIPQIYIFFNNPSFNLFSETVLPACSLVFDFFFIKKVLTLNTREKIIYFLIKIPLQRAAAFFKMSNIQGGNVNIAPFDPASLLINQYNIGNIYCSYKATI